MNAIEHLKKMHKLRGSDIRDEWHTKAILELAQRLDNIERILIDEFHWRRDIKSD